MDKKINSLMGKKLAEFQARSKAKAVEYGCSESDMDSYWLHMNEVGEIDPREIELDNIFRCIEIISSIEQNLINEMF